MKGLDSLLRRCYGIREFSRDPDCLLRLAVTRSRRDLTLADGTTIRRGEPVGDLHLWNERIPPMPPGGPDLAWGLRFQRRLKRSLEELVAYLASEPGLEALRAFRAVGSFMSRPTQLAGANSAGGTAARPGNPATVLAGPLMSLAERMGFEIVDDDGAPGFWRRFAEFWENAFNLALVWAYNRPSLRSRTLPGLRRVQLWVSREGLVRKYGPMRVKARSAGRNRAGSGKA